MEENKPRDKTSEKRKTKPRKTVKSKEKGNQREAG